MKSRIAVLLLLIITSVFCSFAQVCKILDTNDSVEVLNFTVKDNSIVEVTVSNDSQNNSANVTVVIEALYKYGGTTRKETFEGKGLAKANSSTIITIPIKPNSNLNTNYKLDSVSVLEIKGSKCR